jgi:hypothetical protein
VIAKVFTDLGLNGQKVGFSEKCLHLAEPEFHFDDNAVYLALSKELNGHVGTHETISRLPGDAWNELGHSEAIGRYINLIEFDQVRPTFEQFVRDPKTACFR